MASAEQELLPLLQQDGLVRSPNARLIPLTGGVSSEIYLVEDDDVKFVVKRALAKLKVQDDWFADVSRNAVEFAFLQTVSQFLPDAVPAPLKANAAAGYFAMEYLGEGFANWKKLMMDGVCNPAHASAAGRLLGTLQKQTWGDQKLATQFDTIENFRQLRISPYLLTTAERLSEFAAVLRDEAAKLDSARECLTHGDYSPKNMLINGNRLVMVDCEVAWFGAATFDSAFLLTHLFLKMLYHAPHDLGGAKMIEAFWREFTASRGSTSATDFESRVSKLTMMLMLARVHGKSKVEYLTADKSPLAVEFVRDVLGARIEKISQASALWQSMLQKKFGLFS